MIEPAVTYYTGSMPKPEYPFDRVVPEGRCVRGWIPFVVPDGDRSDRVVHSPRDTTPVEWTLPAK